jgi:lipopolysaccharide export system protein LptA
MLTPLDNYCRSIAVMPSLKSILRWAAAGLVLQVCLAHALPEDQQQPIHVTADNAVQENNTVTYRGNVIIVQGSIRIEADQVVIYHEKGKLQKAIATGKPVRFWEQPEADGGIITGRGATLIYYNTDQRVELLQDAFVDRDKNTVKGDRIEYLLPTKTVRAETTSNDANNRVEMVLQPNQPKAGDKPAAPPAQPAPAAEPPSSQPPEPAQPAPAPAANEKP